MLTMGLTRLVLVAPRALSAIPRRSRCASGATARARRARRRRRRSTRRWPAVALSDRLSARPREFAGRRAARCATPRAAAIARRARTARSRSCSAPRCRDCRTTSSRAARSSATIPANPAYRARSTSPRPCRSRRTRCASRRWRRRRLARAALRAGDARRDRRRCTRTPRGRSPRCASSIPRMPRRLMPRLRRLFARAGLEREEVNILRGILARIDQLIERRVDEGAAPLIARRARSRAAARCTRARATSQCRNCGATAPGAFCPQCGQETTIALPTARQFLRDAAGRYVAFDGRLWRTLAALLFRPGLPDARVPGGTAPALRAACATVARAVDRAVRGVPLRRRVPTLTRASRAREVRRARRARPATTGTAAAGRRVRQRAGDDRDAGPGGVTFDPALNLVIDGPPGMPFTRPRSSAVSSASTASTARRRWSRSSLGMRALRPVCDDRAAAGVRAAAASCSTSAARAAIRDDRGAIRSTSCSRAHDRSSLVVVADDRRAVGAVGRALAMWTRRRTCLVDERRLRRALERRVSRAGRRDDRLRGAVRVAVVSLFVAAIVLR